MLKKLRKSARPVVVTQRGRAAAVMMSIEAYEQVEHEREIQRALMRGEREIAAGKGHEMSDVMAEADKILSEPRKNRLSSFWRANQPRVRRTEK